MTNEWTRRHFLGVASACCAAAALPWRVAALSRQAGAMDKERFAFVDPELRAALANWHQIHLPQDLPEIRKIPLQPALPSPAPAVETRKIPGPPGAPPVEVWIVNPNPGKKGQPVFVHTHGGGYVAQNGHVFPFIQEIAVACQCVVVSVNYRLAPETHFPGSLEDNYAALRWVHANAQELGIDRARIAVGGESAGGGHAAMLAIHARDRGEVPIVKQILIYPMLDDRTGSSRVAPPSIGQFIWTASCNRYGWSALLGREAGGADEPAGSVPARVANLAGLPPAWVGVGSIDLFVEEDLAYAGRLIAAGVPVEAHVYPGAYHGFDIFVPEARISKRFTAEWQESLRRAFAGN